MSDAANAIYRRSFISYSHRDAEAATRLRTLLVQRGADVWLDERKLQIADDFPRDIRTAIEEREIFLPVLSSNSLASRWVSREIDIALRSARERGTPLILPVRIEPVGPWPTLAHLKFLDAAKESFGETLIDQLIVPFRLFDPERPAPGAYTQISRHMLETYRPILDFAHETRGVGPLRQPALERLFASIPRQDTALALEALAFTDPETPPSPRIKYALALTSMLTRFGVGGPNLRRVLAGALTGRDEIQEIALSLGVEVPPSAMDDAISIFAEHLRDDTCFNSFLSRNIEHSSEHVDRLCGYILQPDRGPADYNLDSLFLLLTRYPNLAALEARYDDWLRKFYFARPTNPNFEKPVVLFGWLLDYHRTNPAFQRMLESTTEWMRRLLNSDEEFDLCMGLFLLIALLEACVEAKSDFLSVVYRKYLVSVHVTQEAYVHTYFAIRSRILTVMGRLHLVNSADIALDQELRQVLAVLYKGEAAYESERQEMTELIRDVTAARHRDG